MRIVVAISSTPAEEESSILARSRARERRTEALEGSIVRSSIQREKKAEEVETRERAKVRYERVVRGIPIHKYRRRRRPFFNNRGAT